MATSLARQLQKLSTPQTSILLDKPDRKSILFDPSEAGKYDKKIYYQIGREGFDELCQSVPALQEFNRPLFAEKTQHIQRAVLDKEANEKLDKTINKCLIVLSPYLERQSALKAMEWLVYRFMAHEMNRRALLMSIFPYYESALFIRILQIINVHQDTDDWHWLLGSQKSGRPLAKATVFTRWAHYQTFRAFVGDCLREALNIHSNFGEQKLAAAFFVTTVAGGLCLLKEVKEEHLMTLVELMPKCCSPQSCTELTAGAYLLLSQLCVKTKMESKPLNNILHYVVNEEEKIAPELHEQLTLVLLTITQHQKINFTPEIANSISKMPFVFKNITNLAQTKSVAPFLCAYINGFIGWLVSCPCKLEKDKKKKSVDLLGMIELIESIPLSSTDSSKVIWAIIEGIKGHGDKLEGIELAGVLDQLEASHPEGHSKATAKLIGAKAKKSGKEYSKIQELLESKDTTSQSFLHLVHPNATIRLKAVKNFVEKINCGEENDNEKIVLHMSSLLSDTNPDIITEIFSSPICLGKLDPIVILKEAQNILNRESQEHDMKKWKVAKLACVKYLTSMASSIPPSSHPLKSSDPRAKREYDSMNSNLLNIFLPLLLFPDLSSGLSLSKIIMSSGFCDVDPFLSKVKVGINKAEEKKKLTDVQVYAEKIWSFVPAALWQLSEAQLDTLWLCLNPASYNTMAEDQNLTDLTVTSSKSPFISQILMCFAMNGKLSENVKVKISHSLIDSCLDLLDNVKISTAKKIKGKEMLTYSGLTSVLEEIDNNGCMPLCFLGLCISQSLKGFTLPSKCKQTPFWTLSMESSVGEGHLCLLAKCMRCAMMVESHGQYGIKIRNKLMASILKECLQSSEERFNFLSLIWGYVSTLPYSHVIDEKLQIWALKLGTSLITAQASELSWTLGTTQALIPALLCTTSHHRQPLRHQALQCIEQLAAVKGGRLTQKNHGAFVSSLLAQGAELVSDCNYLPSILLKVQGENRGVCREISEMLGDVAGMQTLPPHLCATIIFSLTKVMDLATLQKLIPVADRILETALKIQIKQEVSSAVESNTSPLDSSSSLCLYYILLHFSPSTAEVLDKKEGLVFFTKALGCSQTILNVNNEIMSPQSVLMDQVMSHKFFQSIKSSKLQCQLWSLIISHIVASQNPREAEQLRKGLSKVSLDAALLVEQIEALRLTERATTIREAKAKRMKMKEAESRTSELQNWRKLDLMLETIGVMAKLERPWLLIGPLCHCLQQSLQVDATFTDLTQQQILTVILHLLQQSSEQLGKDLKSHIQLNTEVIVQCIRASSSPDTHRRAMLILSCMATIDPDCVVQKVMPIFTFMGTSLMRRDDSYSFQVIHQTIHNIVPPLLKNDNNDEPVEHRIGRMCCVFIDALPDIPQHRRLPLFTELTNVIDPHKYLWIILTLLVDGYVTRGNIKEDDDRRGDDDKKSVPWDIQFALTLASQYPIKAQNNACYQMVKFIGTLPLHKDLSANAEPPTKKARMETHTTQKSTTKPLPSTHTPLQAYHFKHTIAGLIAHLLGSEAYVREICAREEGGIEEEGGLLEEALRYYSDLGIFAESVRGKPAERVVSSLQRKLLDITTCSISLLSPAQFLQLIAFSPNALLGSSEPHVRQKSMEILCQKLQKNSQRSQKDTRENSDHFGRDSEYFSESERYSLRKILPVLGKLWGDGGEGIEVRQTALLAQQLIISGIEGIDKKVLKALRKAVEFVKKGDEDKKLQMQALLVIAECVGVVKAEALDQVHIILPVLIQLLRTESKVANREEQYLFLASVTLLHKLADTMPKLLPSESLCGVVCVLCELAGSNTDLGQAATKVSDARTFIISRVEPHMLLPILKNAFKELSEGDIVGVGILMEMMEYLLETTTTKTIHTYHNDITNIFIQAMDLRSIKGSVENIDGVESRVFGAIDKLLKRLNQHNNLTIFSAIQNWAKDNTQRYITFYRLSEHLAGIFKVLFIKAQLAEKMFGEAASLLNRNNLLHNRDTILRGGRDGSKNTCLLLSAIMDSLSKVFLYDSVAFTNHDRFMEIVIPLTDQLENTIGGEEKYEERINSHLIPCIKNLAVSVGDDSLWKTLNRQILLRVHNDDQPQIVLAALSTFQTLIEALRSDYLEPLLSDTMPYITEALESTSSEVEEKTRDLFTVMEQIMGQSLKEYLHY